MAIASQEIVARLCRAAASHHFPLGAIRVQKLLYLMECEYYRWERKRLTDETWLYFHYGPWSQTLDGMLRSHFQIEAEEFGADGRQINRIRYDENEFYRMPDRFNDFVIQGIFERVVEEWLVRPIEDLLDYVYFHTAPMKHVQRREKLDFSTIPSPKDEVKPINPYALGSHKRKEALKQGMAAWRASVGQTRRERAPVDEAFIEATRAMDAAEASPPLNGEIELTGDVAARLSQGD